MKEYLRSDGDSLAISYMADEAVTEIIYNVYDLDIKDYIQADQAESLGDGVFSILLSQDVCKYDRNLKIELQIISINQYTEDDLYINLVRPYATAEEIAEELGFTITETPTSDKQYTKAQIEKLERKARLFIDSKINDSFNFEYKTVGTYGMNTDLLHLGNRIEIAMLSEEIIPEHRMENMPPLSENRISGKLYFWCFIYSTLRRFVFLRFWRWLT